MPAKKRVKAAKGAKEPKGIVDALSADGLGALRPKALPDAPWSPSQTVQALQLVALVGLLCVGYMIYEEQTRELPTLEVGDRVELKETVKTGSSADAPSPFRKGLRGVVAEVPRDVIAYKVTVRFDHDGDLYEVPAKVLRRIDASQETPSSTSSQQQQQQQQQQPPGSSSELRSETRPSGASKPQSDSDL